MAHKLGQDRLMAEVNRVSQQIAQGYAGQDLRQWQVMFDAQMDAELARFREESDNEQDPMKQIMADILRQNVPGISGQPGGTPAQPTAPRPIQIPNMPPPRGGGGPRPQAAPPVDPTDPMGIRRRPQ
jgi:hypothetical protein